MAESHDFYKEQARDVLLELRRRKGSARAASTFTDSPCDEKRFSEYASGGYPQEVPLWKVLWLLDRNGELGLLTSLAERLAGEQHHECPLDRVQESCIAASAALQEVKEAQADGNYSPHELRTMHAAAAENARIAQETLDAVDALKPGPVAVSGEKVSAA